MKIRSVLLILTLIAALFGTLACAEGAPSDADSSGGDVDAMSPATDGSGTLGHESDDTSDTALDTDSLDEYLGNSYVYVALGDSIAYGYGLVDFENECYPKLVYDAIVTDENPAAYSNYAVNGDTSADLIELLDEKASINSDAEPLRHADLITVSIGANNVLGPSLAKLSEYYAMASSADPNLAALRIPQIYDEMMAANEAGIEAFEADIVTIMNTLKLLAPEAKIVLQTVYNPYRHVNVEFDFIKAKLDLASETERLVSALNAIIKSNADTLGYTVADVYTAFNDQENVVNADSFTGDVNDFATAIVDADPHPNKAGHELIAEVILDSIGIAQGTEN